EVDNRVNHLFDSLQAALAAYLSVVYFGNRLDLRHCPEEVFAKHLSDLGFGVATPQHFVRDQDKILGTTHSIGQIRNSVEIRPDPAMVDARHLLDVSYM